MIRKFTQESLAKLGQSFACFFKQNDASLGNETICSIHCSEGETRISQDQGLRRRRVRRQRHVLVARV